MFQKLKEKKKKFYQIIEENNKSFKEDEIQTLEEENKKIIHEGYVCINCKQNPIIGNRYKCEFCLDYNLCEECYNENIKGKIKHNHKSFNKIDEIIERKNNIIMNNQGFKSNADYNPNYNAVFSNVVDFKPVDEEKKKKQIYLKKIITNYKQIAEYVLFPELNNKNKK